MFQTKESAMKSADYLMVHHDNVYIFSQTMLKQKIHNFSPKFEKQQTVFETIELTDLRWPQNILARISPSGRKFEIF